MSENSGPGALSSTLSCQYDGTLAAAGAITYASVTGDPPPAGMYPPGTKILVEKVSPGRGGTAPSILSKYVYEVPGLSSARPPIYIPDRILHESSLSLSDVVSNRLGKFNPPPHKSSRQISPTAFSNYSLSKSANKSTVAGLQTVNQRGFIYQDVEAAFDNQGSPKAAKDLWGFQFMYNPTTIQHSNTSDPNIDWTNTADVSALLIGTQTVQFSLLLNRVVDMSALSDSYYPTGSFPGRNTSSGGYPKTLSAADINGILSRGTEYDLEFLYRTINGEPQLGPSMSAPTADFGYLAAIPIWVRFHDNLRYKGVISNISVNHVMFSEKMIPVLTEVSLSFTRIPTPVYGSTSDQSTWFNSKFSADKMPKWKQEPANTSGSTTDAGATQP